MRADGFHIWNFDHGFWILTSVQVKLTFVHVSLPNCKDIIKTTASQSLYKSCVKTTLLHEANLVREGLEGRKLKVTGAAGEGLKPEIP